MSRIILALLSSLTWHTWAEDSCTQVPAPSSVATQVTYQEIAIPGGQALTSFARFTTGIFDRDWIFLTANEGLKVLKEGGDRLLPAREALHIDTGADDRLVPMTPLEMFHGPYSFNVVSFTGGDNWAIQLSYLNGEASLGGAAQGQLGTIVKDPLIQVADHAAIWNGDAHGRWWPDFAYQLKDGRIFYRDHFSNTSLQNALGIEPEFGRQLEVFAYSADRVIEAKIQNGSRHPFAQSACFQLTGLTLNKLVTTYRYPLLISLERGHVVISEFSDHSNEVQERWRLTNDVTEILDAKWVDGKPNMLVRRDGQYLLLIQN